MAKSDLSPTDGVITHMDETSRLGPAWLRGCLHSTLATDVCLAHMGREGLFENLADMMQEIV